MALSHSHCLVIDCNGCRLDRLSLLLLLLLLLLHHHLLLLLSSSHLLPRHSILAPTWALSPLHDCDSSPTDPTNNSRIRGRASRTGSSGQSLDQTTTHPYNQSIGCYHGSTNYARDYGAALGPAGARPGNEGPAPCLISFRQSPGMVIGRALPSMPPLPCTSTPEPNIGSRPKRTRMQQMPPVFFHSSDASAMYEYTRSTCARGCPLWLGSIGGNKTSKDSHSHPPLPAMMLRVLPSRNHATPKPQKNISINASLASRNRHTNFLWPSRPAAPKKTEWLHLTPFLRAVAATCGAGCGKRSQVQLSQAASKRKVF
ncbi:hypothetical protein J3F84DRAFT_319365 [Trichoderma pleuroticola]